MSRWGPTAVVLLLLAGTAVAFATTERQKLEKTPFAVLHVDRDFSPRRTSAGIALRFRRRHVLTVQILDARGRVVETLAREESVRRGTVLLKWAGTGVPDGDYRPQVTLDNGRIFDLPTPIRVDSRAPSSRLVSYRPHVLGRRAKPRVLVSYRLSEPAHPILYVNGRKAVGPGFAKALAGKIEWFAERNQRRLRPGRYRLQIAAVDLAGNVGARTSVFVARIR